MYIGETRLVEKTGGKSDFKFQSPEMAHFVSEDTARRKSCAFVPNKDSEETAQREDVKETRTDTPREPKTDIGRDFG